MRPPLAVPARYADWVPSFSTSCPSLAADDNDGLLDAHPLLGVELLAQREGVVRLVIVGEGDGDHVVAVLPAGGRLVGCEVFIGHGGSLKSPTGDRSSRISDVVAKVLEASPGGGRSEWPIIQNA